MFACPSLVLDLKRHVSAALERTSSFPQCTVNVVKKLRYSIWMSSGWRTFHCNAKVSPYLQRRSLNTKRAHRLWDEDYKLDYRLWNTDNSPCFILWKACCISSNMDVQESAEFLGFLVQCDFIQSSCIRLRVPLVYFAISTIAKFQFSVDQCVCNDISLRQQKRLPKTKLLHSRSSAVHKHWK